MKTLRIFIGMVLILTANFANAAEQTKIVKEYSFGKYNKLVLNGNFQVVLFQNEKSTVKVEGSKADFLDFNLSETGLELQIIQQNYSTNPIIVRIGMPESLKEISLEGNINLYNSALIEQDFLKITVAGISDVNLRLELNNFEADVNGAATLNISGKAQWANIRFAAAGKIDAHDFAVADCSINHEGVGQVFLNATSRLHVAHSGLGKIEYTGNPEVLNQEQ